MSWNRGVVVGLTDAVHLIRARLSQSENLARKHPISGLSPPSRGV